MKIANIIKQAIRPSRSSVMLKKLYKRLNDTKGRKSDAENWEWLREHSKSFADFAKSIDVDLWRESESVAKRIAEAADKKLHEVEYDLGGGGAYPLLYFVTRLKRPAVIVETGVAAGYSSAAFLEALEANAHGHLYSSDFPYFRIPEPERYIGIVVDDAVKSRWHLYIEGDEKNLKSIIAEVPAINIFHYDSDKSYSGRHDALREINKLLTEDALIIMDDIQDNSFFMDYIHRNTPDFWVVFEFQAKYVGMLGSLSRNADVG